MDTSDPAIVFDEEGFCNHCSAYLDRISQMVYQGPASDQKLQFLIERVKRAGRGRSYDCVVGVSGGTDSSYLAYLAKHWGLRPLAVHMDNGWNSQEAVRNIKGICDKLTIDYTSYVLTWEDFKDIQLAFLKASIVEMEIPTDVALQAALHKVAAENGVKFILSGGNLANEGILPTSWFYYPKDSKLLRAIHQKFGSRKVKSYETFDFLEEIYYKFVRGIRILYPLNHVRYSKVDAARFLSDNLGWIDYGGAHHESLFTKIVQSYIQPRKFGVDYRRCLYSTQICTGHLTREQALVQLETPPYQSETIEHEKAYVAKKLGLDLPGLETILQSPPRSYRDFPNNEKLLSLIYRTYRRIFRTTHSFPSASYE